MSARRLAGGLRGIQGGQMFDHYLRHLGAAFGAVLAQKPATAAMLVPTTIASCSTTLMPVLDLER
jgi:hypothetical protein